MIKIIIDGHPMKAKIILFLIIIILAGQVIGVSVTKEDVRTLTEPGCNTFVEWDTALDSNFTDKPGTVHQTKDGGYIVTGAGYAFDIWLIKLDNKGNKEWENHFDYLDWDYGRDVVEVDDGYVVLGMIKQNEIAEKVVLIKTDKQGNMIWERFISCKKHTAADDIDVTHDDGFIITGYTSDYNVLMAYDAWLCKLDKNGYEQWNKTYEISYYNRAESVEQTSDGGYVIASGRMMYLDSESRLRVIRTDDKGEIIWDNVYGDDETWNRGHSIQITDDEGFIALGENIIVKLDKDGETEWSKDIGGFCVQPTRDGGYIITGEQERINGYKDLKLTKLNENGDISWERLLGGLRDDFGVYIEQTIGGGFIITGRRSFYVDVGPYSLIDVWVIKTKEKPALGKSITVEKTDFERVSVLFDIIFKRYSKYDLSRYFL